VGDLKQMVFQAWNHAQNVVLKDTTLLTVIQLDPTTYGDKVATSCILELKTDQFIFLAFHSFSASFYTSNFSQN